MKRPVPASYNVERVRAFVENWKKAEASERSNAQPFLLGLCQVLGVDPPPPRTGAAGHSYCFEREVLITHPDGHTSTGFIDFYKRGHFVLEAKQGADATKADNAKVILFKAPKKKKGHGVRETAGYDVAMQDAYVQAEKYARALDEWPPFLLICDVGYRFEVYASFDGSGKYRHFPTPQRHRILLEQLVDPEVFTFFYDVFTDPFARDPSREAAKVTRDIAAHLARLAQSLEAQGHAPELVAKFLMRCLFTMFAEDVNLLPPSEHGHGVFTEAIEKHWMPKPERFPSEVEALWRAMNSGGALFGVAGKILQFNGGLFADPVALPLSKEQLQVLHLAALSDWAEVEPAIFGTLLERALNPKERHRLGAHFTPRLYVERLVSAAVEQPLRSDWDLVRAEVRQLVTLSGKVDEAKKVLQEFHRKIVAIRVLDPACGTGNFLYVTLDLFKRIEAEVLGELASLGEAQLLLDVQHVTVNPGQFLGLEVKPWAREIADLVLWIGYLQWHHKTRGRVQPAEPVLRDYKNIVCRDALLTWDRVEPLTDESGRPVVRWDGESFKVSPTTGEEIPDEAKTIATYRYIAPRRAEWPEADFVVGNPPFIGNFRLRTELGNGYVEALREVYDDLPENADFVMYWWDHAAKLVSEGLLRRAGLITTTSITQTFNRKVVEKHIGAASPVSIVFAAVDHPWVSAKYGQTKGGAEVRIAMTVIEKGTRPGILARVVHEYQADDFDVRSELAFREGVINADLTIGANVAGTLPLRANEGLSSPGVKLHGAGFIVTREQARQLGLGRIPGLELHIRPYRNGQDIASTSRDAMVIDLFGLEADDVRRRFPEVYQWVLERVKPERDHNNERYRRENWWLFGRRNTELRAALRGLRRYISTIEVARRRYFVFLDGSILPDNTLINIALDDAFFLGVLSSRIHVVWSLAAGGRMGVRHDPRYNKTRCFDPFPFPDCDETARQRIADLGEALDQHRKRQQALHPKLTLTKMYKVMNRLESREPLDDEDRLVHEHGLIAVLRQIQRDLDAAVADAYGWPAELDDEAILERIVALNGRRVADERVGRVLWLRPEYQRIAEEAPVQSPLGLPEEVDEAAQPEPLAARHWPKSVPEQLAAVRSLIAKGRGGWSLKQVNASFSGTVDQRSKRKDKIAQHLVSLEGLGLLLRYVVDGEPRWYIPDIGSPGT